MRCFLWLGAAATAAVMVCVGGAGAGCGGSTFGTGSDAGGDGHGGSGSSSGGASSSGSSGGSSSGRGGSNSGSGGGSGGGSGSSSGGGVTPCPSNPPGAGTGCMPNGLQCEYGTSPQPQCNQLFECLNGVWASGGPGGMCFTGTCPASYMDVGQGKVCMPDGLDCAYPQGQCDCSFSSLGGTGTMPTWHCFSPQGCPEPRPPVGAACTQPGLSCDYGACSGGISETCMGGYWVWTMTACPG